MLNFGHFFEMPTKINQEIAVKPYKFSNKPMEFDIKISYRVLRDN